MSATLPLGGAELVLTCADCGARSSGDVFGAEHWRLRRLSAQRFVDVCPACAPRPRAKPLARASAPAPRAAITNAAAERVMLIREAAPRRAVGLAIDRSPHLSERCRECGAELRDAIEGAIERDGATYLADFCAYCDAPTMLVRKDGWR